MVGAAIATCSRSCAMTSLSPTIVSRRSTLRAQRAVLGLEPPLPDGVADDQHGLLERQRLLDEVERAQLDRAHRRLDVAVAGDHHDRRVDLPLAQPRQRGQAVHAGQPDVEHDRRRTARATRGRGTPRPTPPPRRRSPRRAARRSARCARRPRRRRSGCGIQRMLGFSGSASAQADQAGRSARHSVSFASPLKPAACSRQLSRQIDREHRARAARCRRPRCCRRARR